MQIAARNGDYITPTIVGTGENDYARDLAASRSLFQLLVPRRGARRGQQGALRRVAAVWVPKCLAAAQALQPIWSQPAEKPITFADVLGRGQGQVPHLLEEIELDIPKELDQ